ncbi:MAG: NUDIX domain-containing protein [Candidatus Diapherotrites archaeon]|nr:NUDIX domain-containing protein [Candidatus Diapherotrites archaeon]
MKTGILPRSLRKKLLDLASRLPRLPDGRIDYSLAPQAPVVSVFVHFKDRFLVLQRSQQVGTYRGKWNVVAGFLDSFMPVEEKALAELREETGISAEKVSFIKRARMYSFKDKSIAREWRVYPVLVELNKKPGIRLDFEHESFRWIGAGEFSELNGVPNLSKGLARVQALLLKSGKR